MAAAHLNCSSHFAGIVQEQCHSIGPLSRHPVRGRRSGRDAKSRSSIAASSERCSAFGALATQKQRGHSRRSIHARLSFVGLNSKAALPFKDLSSRATAGSIEGGGEGGIQGTLVLDAGEDGTPKEHELIGGTDASGSRGTEGIGASGSGDQQQEGQQEGQQGAVEEEEEELSNGQLLWRAAKPPLYSVAFIPLLVGSAVAYLQTGVFLPGRFWSFLFHSVLVILWLNLSNDAFDSETGVDKEKKESIVNITGSRTGVLIAAMMCLAIGGTGLFRGAMAVNDMRVFGLLAAAIVCGYIYQSPPFRLSYKGLGEPLCFVAFGPLATSAFYLYQASSPGFHPVIGPTVMAASVLVGLTTTLILFCSHFHQIESDLSVGKMSPLVRLGTQNGSNVARTAIGFLYAATLSFCAMRLLPLTCIPCLLLTVPVALSCVQFISTNHANKSAIFMAKYYCTKLHIAFGLMLSLGLILGSITNDWYTYVGSFLTKYFLRG